MAGRIFGVWRLLSKLSVFGALLVSPTDEGLLVSGTIEPLEISGR